MNLGATWGQLYETLETCSCTSGPAEHAAISRSKAESFEAFQLFSLQIGCWKTRSLINPQPRMKIHVFKQQN